MMYTILENARVSEEIVTGKQRKNKFNKIGKKKEIGNDVHHFGKFLLIFELGRGHYSNFQLHALLIQRPVNAWVKVFRIIPEFRILGLTFHRKSASKCGISEIIIASLIYFQSV